MMMSEEKKITADDIYGLLAEKYSSSREWAIAGEVQRTTGWSDRRYDFVAMNCFASNRYRIEVVEIKISKPDLRRELEEPEKHNVIFEDIDYYSLAAPAEIIDMSIIPPKWGVYAVKDGKLITKRKPLALHDEEDRRIKRGFVASFLRAAINQNIARKTLAAELKKKFDEGYAQGKKSLLWDSQKQEAFEQYKKEATEYRDLLYKLGFPIYMSEAHGRTEKIKERQELLMKCSTMIQAFNSDSLGWAIRNIEGALGDMKQALESIAQIQKNSFGAPLKPEQRM